MVRLLVLALATTVAFACEWDYRIWIPRDSSADPLYRFVDNGKAGYIDSSGRVVIPPKIETYGGNDGLEFHDGLVETAVSDGRYADRTGNVVIGNNLYRGWDFSEGLAVAMRQGEHLWGYIDSSGKFAISPRFESSPSDYVWSFSDGLAMIEVKGKFGYIDHTGDFVIKAQFPYASDFSDGMAWVITEGPCVYMTDGPCSEPQLAGAGEGSRPACKFSYIDKSGRVITQSRFDYARRFAEGLAPVRVGELWGFIDKTGAVVVNLRFDDAQPFASGLSRIKADGLWGFVDRSGAIKIPARYEYAEDFSEGFAVVGDGSDRYWYIDEQGSRAIAGEFAAASPFFKGLAHVQLFTPSGDGRRVVFAYIDTKGRQVFTYRSTIRNG